MNSSPNTSETADTLLPANPSEPAPAPQVIPPAVIVHEPEDLPAKSAGRLRHGKIARLPEAIREQLNQRLRNGEPSQKILPWLNALPETQRMIEELFEGEPITKWNLHRWRAGGFVESNGHRERMSHLKELASFAMQHAAINGCHFTESAGVMIAARMLEILDETEGAMGFEELDTAAKTLGHLRTSEILQQHAETGKAWLDRKDEQLLLARDQFKLRQRQYQEKLKAEKAERKARLHPPKKRGFTREAQRRIERAARLL